jgi:hypothetical protein
MNVQYTNTMPLVWYPLAVLFVSSTLLLAVGIFIMEMVPVAGGVAPLLQQLWTACRHVSSSWQSLVSDSDEHIKDRDVDVEAERQRVIKQCSCVVCGMNETEYRLSSVVCRLLVPV